MVLGEAIDVKEVGGSALAKLTGALRLLRIEYPVLDAGRDVVGLDAQHHRTWAEGKGVGCA
jgi:hypothetical protein